MIYAIIRNYAKKFALQSDCILQIARGLGAIRVADTECFNMIDNALYGAAMQNGNRLLPEKNLHLAPV